MKNEDREGKEAGKGERNKGPREKGGKREKEERGREKLAELIASFELLRLSYA